MSRGILIDEVERRIIRACKTIRVLPERRFDGYQSAWPQILRLPEEAYGYVDVSFPKFRPTPYDVSDCLVALSWARGMSKRDWKLVWWRSFDVSFKQIADRIYRSDETARRQYRDVILRIWYEANS